MEWIIPNMCMMLLVPIVLGILIIVLVVRSLKKHPNHQIPVDSEPSQDEEVID